MISPVLTLWLVAAGTFVIGWTFGALCASTRNRDDALHQRQRDHHQYWKGYHDRSTHERARCHPLRHAICPDRVYSVQGLIDAARRSPHSEGSR